ncbi:DEAD/DEAH box helicase [Marinisporobacter balticus]|uniref:SNF2 family DNA or RNA helicase n=1 Tax=Marinisporobacter balticus TaxID=2018667 RepID=A0A4R2L5T3_9FIRM|nr:DEAD/DEAH box helicase [Marinisporobacter balticus]TCO79409.1 SNF2 family DNA or RNA helicase [Marinisporobacter balticus]
MFHITNNEILDISSNQNTFIKGKNYYLAKKVKTLEFDKKKSGFYATVLGTRNYRVKVYFDADGNFDDASCTCPAYDQYWGYCKHIVAVLFEVKERNKQGGFKHLNVLQSQEVAKGILNFFHYKQSDIKVPVALEITYEFERDPYNHAEKASYFSLRIGENKLYMVKSIKKLIESIEKKEELYFGKEFTLDPKKHTFKQEDQSIINLLKEIYENEKIIYDYAYGFRSGSLFKGKKVTLTTNALKRFFEMVKHRRFHAVIMNTVYKDINILQKDIPLSFELAKEKKDLLLKIHYGKTLVPLVSDGEYFFTEEGICKISKEQKENFAPFYHALLSQKDNIIKIPEAYHEKFVSEVYPFVRKMGKVHIAEKVKSSIYAPKIKVEVYLDRKDKQITADTKFLYGDIMVNPFAASEKQTHENERILVRDIEKEKEILNLLEEATFKVKNNQVYLKDEEKIFEFVYEKMSKLQNAADVYYSESFKNMEIKDVSSFSGGIRLNTKNDLLEFQFGVEGITNSELTEVFHALKEKKKYYRLKDGSFLPLDTEELLRVEQIVDYLDLSIKDFEQEIIEIPKFRALYLDEHLKETKLKSIKRNLAFKEFVQNIKEPGDVDYAIPQEVEEILRDYQKFGFKWLKTLSEYGLGGILADDMGLGKTLQVLAFLLSEKKEKGLYPSLIVAPTSLVYNWAEEIEKFTPNLKVLIVSGNKIERHEIIKKMMDYDVVITSYPLIRRDIALYENISFRYCILDEAQHIKNQMSQNAKSVKQIKAKNYFALTGTPIENSIAELWSIFDYAMQGYLLSYTKFKKKFEKPIVKDQDQGALDILGKHIRPFILRRLKKDVLKELPEKIEHKIVAELTKEQKKIYLAYLKQIKGEIEEEIKNRGFEKSHIKILSGLTRLRQICCDPSMFIENYQDTSGKVILLEEILNDAIEGGHRILLFSQFTSMLKIIRQKLEALKISYQYLDGSTDMKMRGNLVKDFNEGKGEVFLISLKAGGTGLNLTGADTVIHFDPWWNPAVEEQATDRAYRIGQKNAVHVMKLITKGTIEEKIFQLQEKKKKMIDAVIQPGQTLVSKMSEKDIRALFEG